MLGFVSFAELEPGQEVPTQQQQDVGANDIGRECSLKRSPATEGLSLRPSASAFVLWVSWRARG